MERLAASVSIWKMGDFFRLEDLCEISLDGLKRHFQRTSWLFSADTGTGNASKPLHISYITHLIQALYKEENHKVREFFRAPLLAFLLSVVRFLVATEEVHDALREIPQFASDWAVALMETMSSIGMPHVDDGMCDMCRAMCPVSLDTMEWMKVRDLEKYCSGCFPFHRLEVWTRDRGRSP